MECSRGFVNDGIREVVRCAAKVFDSHQCMFPAEPAPPSLGCARPPYDGRYRESWQTDEREAKQSKVLK